jgi:hypothetical protein
MKTFRVSFSLVGVKEVEALSKEAAEQKVQAWGHNIIAKQWSGSAIVGDLVIGTDEVDAEALE